MSEEKPSEKKVEILDTQLTITVGATVSVNGAQQYGDWFRPSASYSIRWDGVPLEEQLRIATKFAQQEVIAPALEDVIVQISKRLDVRRNGS